MNLSNIMNLFDIMNLLDVMNLYDIMNLSDLMNLPNIMNAFSNFAEHQSVPRKHRESTIYTSKGTVHVCVWLRIVVSAFSNLQNL